MTKAQFTIEEVNGCIQLLVRDSTGLHSLQNPYAWDPGTHLTGNPAISDVTEAVLEVTTSDGKMTSFDLYSDGTTTIAFPNTSDGYKIITGVTSLGGLIRCRMKYAGASIDGAPNTAFTIYKDCDFLLTCKFECCIAKLNAAVAREKKAGCTPCVKAKSKAFNDAIDELNAMEYSFKCGDYNAVQDAVDKLNSICAGNQCGC